MPPKQEDPTKEASAAKKEAKVEAKAAVEPESSARSDAPGEKQFLVHLHDALGDAEGVLIAGRLYFDGSRVLASEWERIKSFTGPASVDFPGGAPLLKKGKEV